EGTADRHSFDPGAARAVAARVPRAVPSARLPSDCRLRADAESGTSARGGRRSRGEPSEPHPHTRRRVAWETARASVHAEGEAPSAFPIGTALGRSVQSWEGLYKLSSS